MSEPMRELQAAIYARVSSEQQAEAQTIASQVAALRARVLDDGVTLVDERTFIDAGYSGATLVRPALERLRDLAAVGGVDRVYVPAPDRLARKYAYQVLLLDEPRAAGVEVVFLNHELGRAPEGDLLLQVQGMVAEYERAQILERSRRGKRHGARIGLVSVLSQAPYGYRYVRKDQAGGVARYEILLEEARVVRQIFQWVGQERATISAVCRRLAAAGERTRTGKTVWEPATVWGMLRNPAYIGSAAFGKTRSGPVRPRLRAPRGRPVQPRRAVSTTRVPAEEWLSIPVPPLVDPTLFAAVQDQLAENRQHARQRQRGARYLLQGLVICARCGYASCGQGVSQARADGTPRHYAYYRCLGTNASHFGGERVCTNSALRTDRLAAAVWQQVRTLLEQPQRLEQEYRRRLQAPAAQAGVAELTAVQAQRSKVRQGLARLIDSYAEGFIEQAEFEPRVTRLRQRLASLEEQAQHLADAATLGHDLRLLIGRLEQFAQQVTHQLDAADWDASRELIRTVVARVEIDLSLVRVIFRVPPHPFVLSPEQGLLLHRSRLVYTSHRLPLSRLTRGGPKGGRRSRYLRRAAGAPPFVREGVGR
jgi:site-specific DNA recombinase